MKGEYDAINADEKFSNLFLSSSFNYLDIWKYFQQIQCKLL